MMYGWIWGMVGMATRLRKNIIIQCGVVMTPLTEISEPEVGC